MKQKQVGFTLIEVLIALAILAIALVAVIKVSGQSVSNVTHIKEKLASHAVAMNALSEAQVGMIKLDSQTREQQGVSNSLGQVWRWQIKAEQGTQDKYFERVEVTVKPLHSENVVEILHGFILNAGEK